MNHDNGKENANDKNNRYLNFRRSVIFSFY